MWVRYVGGVPWRASGNAERLLAWVRSRKVDRRVIAVGSLGDVAFLGFLVQYIAPGLVDRVLRRGDDPPLAVTLEIAPPVGAADDENNVFFVPRLADETPPPPRECRRIRAWAPDMGGNDVGTTTVRVYLQSSADHNVIVDGTVDAVQMGEQAQPELLSRVSPAEISASLGVWRSTLRTAISLGDSSSSTAK